MTWQKIRKQIHGLWVPGLSKVLDIHVARYRKSGVWDELGRVTFVHEKSEIYVLSDSEDWKRCWDLFDMGRLYVNLEPELAVKSDKVGYYDVDRFYKLTDIYINKLDVTKAFESNVLLFQIYAILDRRIGKRTLAKNLDLIKSSEILELFYGIRIQTY